MYNHIANAHGETPNKFAMGTRKSRTFLLLARRELRPLDEYQR